MTFWSETGIVSPKEHVLYDGTCGFCSWWIPFWKKVINRAGYEIAPLQSDWVRGRLKIGGDELASDIRVLLSDGTSIDGADAYIYGMKQVWWGFPMGFVLGLPIFRQGTWLLYKAFNRNRFLFSRFCRLKPEISPGSKNLRVRSSRLFFSPHQRLV